MDWSGRKVLVTGATGFIGSHLTERLLTMGAQVRAMTHGTDPGSNGFLVQIPDALRGNLEIRGGDLIDQPFVFDMVRGMDTVFHIGAITSVKYSYVYPEESFRTNVMGTYNVCAAVREFGCRRMVHTSSGGQYGDAHDNKPITEDHPLSGMNPYTASKIAADTCCETFYRSYDTPIAICRIFNTYGPRMGRFLIMPTIIMQLLESDTIQLGDLRPMRTFTYVDDIVNAFLRMAEADCAVGDVIHFGSDKAVSMGDLVSLTGQLMQKTPNVITDPDRLRPGKSEIMCTLVNASKAKRLLDWEAKVDLETGLKKTIEWMAAGGYNEVRPNQVV